jgi:uncharacterized protein YkwD
MRGNTTGVRIAQRIGLVTLCLTLGVSAARAATEPPTNEEYALLVLANQARSEPSAFGYDRPVVPPLSWNDDLARAARAHSTDMAANGCYQHDSCSGQTWWRRIQQFYAGWTGLAENIIAIGDTPEQMHSGWMASSGHRANILAGGLYEFGAGIAIGDGNFGPIAFGTEDFGTRALPSLRSLPAIPAGVVLPRTGSDPQRRLLVNYYDYDGPPLAVRALVGGACVDLDLETGVPAHGTYAARRGFPGQGCTPVLFEAIDAAGVRHRFPAQGAILVAAGGAACAQRTDDVPTQDCGGPDAPAATPAPAPAPTPLPSDDPVDESTLRKLRVVLAPGVRDASKGQVSIVATLPPVADFDPSGAELDLAVGFPGGDWTRSLPAACGGDACLKPNKRGTAFRAEYALHAARASFTRDQRGRWTFRYASRGETIGRVKPGEVSFDIRIGDLVLTGTGRGVLEANKLVAE